MAGFEVTLHGRFWVTPEVPLRAVTSTAFLTPTTTRSTSIPKPFPGRSVRRLIWKRSEGGVRDQPVRDRDARGGIRPDGNQRLVQSEL